MRKSERESKFQKRGKYQEQNVQGAVGSRSLQGACSSTAESNHRASTGVEGSRNPAPLSSHTAPGELHRRTQTCLCMQTAHKYFAKTNKMTTLKYVHSWSHQTLNTSSFRHSSTCGRRPLLLRSSELPTHCSHVCTATDSGSSLRRTLAPHCDGL